MTATQPTIARDIRREERIAVVLRLVPDEITNPRGVNAHALARRSGYSLQQVLGALECLVKRNEVIRLTLGAHPARYVTQARVGISVGATDPIAVYRREKQRRRERNKDA
jgi:hypothetical protein